MKSKYLSCFSRVFVFAFLLLNSLNTLVGQSPDSVAGATFDMRVTAGAPPFASTGRYLLLFRGNSDWVSYNVSGLADGAGTYFYSRTAFEYGYVQFQDFSFSDFLFERTNSGHFSMGAPNSDGYQDGIFKVYSGSAPSSLTHKIINITTNTGTLNFGSSGPYRIITTSSTAYQVQNASGSVVHSGSYSYGRTNRASGVFRFQDSTHAAGFMVLNFESGNSGLSVIRKSTNQAVQIGLFAMSDLQPPVFTSQPTTRSVPVGSPTTFSATVTGTPPFTYQWYKDNAMIGGATGSSYTIPSVQLWDAGGYRIVASGLAGSVSSATAVLTPVCHYSLPTNSMSVDFRGGLRNTTVFAAGTCPWTASTTNSWITITSATAGQGNSGLTFMVEGNESNTPRTGSLQIAGKTLVIAQGARFAVPDVAGRTLRLDFSSDVEDDGLLLLSSGTNRVMRFVPFTPDSAAETFDYSYSVLSSSNAQIHFSSGDLFLTFTNAKSGTFVLTNNESPQSGIFTMSSLSPDFNEDGRGDLVLQGPTGGFAAWHMQNTNFLGVRLLHNGRAPNAGGRAFGTADFNRDGQTDIAIQDSSGRLLVWFMQGTNRIGGMTLRNGTAAAGWRAFSVADVNSDGHPDVLFQNNSDRRLSAWLFNGTTFLGGMSIRNGQPAAVGWRAVGASDLNGDAQTDVLLQHESGQISAWFLNGGQFASVEILRNGVAPAKWKVMGIGDVDEDGSADILWQNENNQVAAWLFNGKQFVRAIFLRDGKAAGAGWKVVAPR